MCVFYDIVYIVLIKMKGSEEKKRAIMSVEFNQGFG